MKTKWNNIVQDYFTFSAKERKGTVIILVLIVLVYIAARVIPVKKQAPSKDAFAKELAQLKITVDSSHNTYARTRFNRYDDDNDNAGDYIKPKNYDSRNTAQGELFVFDPNTLDAEGWKKLGIRDKTVTTIQNFLAKGFRFRQPDDLKNVYGLKTEEAERLIPYVHIAEQEAAAHTAAAGTGTSTYTSTYTGSSFSEAKAVKTIDVNLADTSAFIALPGIGSKLAARIVNFRDKLGGFYTVNQVGETYGVPDSTFQKIKSRLLCNNVAVKKINLNNADVNQLKAHPYIRWSLANAIVNYRSQHGNFTSLQDLKKIDVITDEVFNKIAPYLEI